MTTWDSLNRTIIRCRQCPRLRTHCHELARHKRRAFVHCIYWAKPVPNFGDARGRLLIVGLAPAGHGANRTGRMFTGDRSGEWLFRALHKAGFANRAESTHAEDGLELIDCAITAACHCAPPGNKPSRDELANCSGWLQETIDLLPVRLFLALGQIAWRAVIEETRRRGWYEGKMPKFGHGRRVDMAGGRYLLGSYHPSQQNTFTGRLTERMFDSVFRTANELLGAGA